MPCISVESGKLTAEQKIQLIEQLTATASEITNIPAQFFTVTVKELSHSWESERIVIDTAHKSIEECQKELDRKLHCYLEQNGIEFC